MRILNLKSQGVEAEVILEQFDEDPKRAVMTVIDLEGNPATVTLSREEVMEISEWAEDFLEVSR